MGDVENKPGQSWLFEGGWEETLTVDMSRRLHVSFFLCVSLWSLLLCVKSRECKAGNAPVPNGDLPHLKCSCSPRKQAVAVAVASGNTDDLALNVQDRAFGWHRSPEYVFPDNRRCGDFMRGVFATRIVGVMWTVNLGSASIPHPFSIDGLRVTDQLRGCESIVFSPNGARYASPGRSPGNECDINQQP